MPKLQSLEIPIQGMDCVDCTRHVQQAIADLHSLGVTSIEPLTGYNSRSAAALAAFGFLPPAIAAAAQSLPDLGILANSSRLLRQK